MSGYLNHIYRKESEKDSNKKKGDETNTTGQSSQPRDKPSMTGGTKKPKDFDKWIEQQKAKKAKVTGESAVPKRPPPAGQSGGRTTRRKSPPLPPKNLKPILGKKAREGAVTEDETRKKPRKGSVAPVNDGPGPPKLQDSKGRLDSTADSSRPKDEGTAKSEGLSTSEAPEKAESESEAGDPLNRYTKYPSELTSQDAEIAARYRQRLQALCRAIDDDSTPPDPDRSKEEEDPELLGVFREVSDRFEEVRKWMRMVEMDWEAFEQLEERAGEERVQGGENGDFEEGEVLEGVRAGDGVEDGEREDENLRSSSALEAIEEEKTDELDVAAEPELDLSDQGQGGETPGYRPSPAQSPPHVPSDDEQSRPEPQDPAAAAESDPAMDADQRLSDQLQGRETPGCLSSSSQSPAPLPSEDEPHQEPSDQLEGRETPGYVSSPSRSPPRMPSEDEPQQEVPDPRQQRETLGYLSSSSQGSAQLPPNDNPSGTEPQGGAAPQTILSSILSSLQQHADAISRTDPHAIPTAPAGHNDGTAAETVDPEPKAFEHEAEASQASVGNPPQDVVGTAPPGTDSDHEHDETDDLFNEEALGPVEYSPEIDATPRFETATELPRSDVSVLDGDEGAFVPHAGPPNTSLPGLGLHLPPMTTAAGSSVETSAGPSANLPGLHYGQGLDARAQPSLSTSGTAENGSGDASPVAANSIVADESSGTGQDQSVAGQYSPSKAAKRKSTSDDDESPRKKSRSNSPTETQFR
ncbi:hypothetical protein KC360_g2790 [Hortaea werneckii]|nr:hypothetical protein KC325_g3494 [Hortaea werneckii]KAI6996288.1 hypothetical protein KC359_g3599 [Hortaea werneckii]KAI7146613.1 hypothetical protein KC344_g3545 [Hortaea werneckii]KAI7176829.1 hypothetical protein KC360_g2790 [Hortaea werneckii]